MASTARGSSTRIAGLNSMPTETKKSTAKASRSGSVSCAARWLKSRLAQDHAGEEGAEREGHAEQLGRANRRRQGRSPAPPERNSSREPVCAIAWSTQGITRLPTISMTATKAATLPSVSDDGPSNAGKSVGLAPSPPRTGGQCRQQHQRREPSRGPRRSASRPRCGRARSRSGAAPAGRAAAPRCWRRRARGRTRGRRRSASRATCASAMPSAVAKRSARRRRGSRSLAPTGGRRARSAGRRRTSAG